MIPAREGLSKGESLHGEGMSGSRLWGEALPKDRGKRSQTPIRATMARLSTQQTPRHGAERTNGPSNTSIIKTGGGFWFISILD